MDQALLPDVQAFLKQAAPFSALPESALGAVCRQLKIRYLTAGMHTELLSERALFWLRKGAARLLNSDGSLLDLLEESGCFGSLLQGLPRDARLELTDDALLYRLDEQQVQLLISSYPAFARFVQQSSGRYLHHPQPLNQESILQRPCRELIRRQPVTIAPSASVQQAAHLMTQQRISSLPVIQNDRLLGLITDRDLRSRVLAEGLGSDTPVESVMTRTVQTIDADADLMDAQLLMATQRVHHLPVMKGERLKGIITSTDLVDLQRNSPIFLTGELARQTELTGLVKVSGRLPQLFSHLIDCGINAARLGQLLAAAVDVLTQRLLLIAESRFGAPPFSYCWVTLGAHARQELTLASDQDNALILAQAADQAADDYFRQLTEFVCEGLDRCGIRSCSGNIMASNPDLRLSLTDWQNRFNQWISSPTPAALLKASIFFDMRAIGGELGLLDPLLLQIRSKAAGNQLFLAAMAKAACSTRPPLGLFGRLQTHKQDDGRSGIDLKASAISLLVETARLYALAGQSTALSTQRRLLDSGNDNNGIELLSAEDGRNLAKAFELLNRLRYQQHRDSIRQGEALHPWLQPDQLDSLTRHQLKDALVLIERAQAAMLLKFARGSYG